MWVFWTFELALNGVGQKHEKEEKTESFADCQVFSCGLQRFGGSSFLVLVPRFLHLYHIEMGLQGEIVSWH